MATCDFCKKPSHSWVNRGKTWQRVEFKPATKHFLCSKCMQTFLSLPVDLKISMWRGLQRTNAPQRKVKWLESFIPEEVLRDERLKNREFLDRGRAFELAADKEGDFERLEDAKAVPVRKSVSRLQGILSARRL